MRAWPGPPLRGIFLLVLSLISLAFVPKLRLGSALSGSSASDAAKQSFMETGSQAVAWEPGEQGKTRGKGAIHAKPAALPGPKTLFGGLIFRASALTIR